MAQVVHACVAKWKVIKGQYEPRGSCGKQASNRPIFIVELMQFVETAHLHAALWSAAKGAAAIVISKDYRCLSMHSIATPLTNGSEKPSGSWQRCIT